MKSKTNLQLTEIFKDMASIYKYMGADERFRAKSYNKVAKTISSLQEDITFYINNNTLEELPGIGLSIATKIKEFVKTGKIELYEQLKKNAPHELIEMMEIKGFGPKSIKRIQNELKITTKKELINALKENKIENIKGFGKKKTDSMLRGLKLHKTIEERMLLWGALKYGNNLIELLKKIPEIQQISLAGSLRRKKETIGDIDVLIAADYSNRKKIISAFTSSNIAKEVLAKGDTKASIIMKDSTRQADLRIVNLDEWGSALLYFTGSKEHNIHLRTIAKSKGYKMSEYGLFQLSDGKCLCSDTEENIYSKLGYQFIPPEMREDKGEIELAKKNKIPKLITYQDIKGDMQMHSLWSDGSNSIKELANYIRKHFSYDYIVITDHSKASRIANGMDEKRCLEQLKEIKQVNTYLGEDFVKSGIEVDILNDGSLDISDEVLKQIDWVTASIHSGFTHDNTERIIKAIKNPHVNCIGHLTGRLIGQREEYQLDIKRIIEIAKKTFTCLEINAQPSRMDLNDNYAKLAREYGVKITISTDSHSIKDFHYMPLGVDIAKRAWCTSNDILNTKNWQNIEKYKEYKRNYFK